MLCSGLNCTKQLSGLRQEVRLLQPRYQRQFRLSKTTNNQQDVLSLSQLFNTYPRQFWCKASLPHNMLPADLQTPTAWDRYLANLTTALAQVASQLPLLHTVQPPAPAISLIQAITEVELALRSFIMALPEYTSERLRCAKLAATGSEHLLFPRLQLLLYTAFSTGAVPQSWITSLVTPIFKEDATDTANYRPIAVQQGCPLSATSPYSVVSLMACIFTWRLWSLHQRSRFITCG